MEAQIFDITIVAMGAIGLAAGIAAIVVFQRLKPSRPQSEFRRFAFADAELPAVPLKLPDTDPSEKAPAETDSAETPEPPAATSETPAAGPSPSGDQETTGVEAAAPDADEPSDDEPLQDEAEAQALVAPAELAPEVKG